MYSVTFFSKGKQITKRGLVIDKEVKYIEDSVLLPLIDMSEEEIDDKIFNIASQIVLKYKDATKMKIEKYETALGDVGAILAAIMVFLFSLIFGPIIVALGMNGKFIARSIYEKALKYDEFKRRRNILMLFMFVGEALAIALLVYSLAIGFFEMIVTAGFLIAFINLASFGTSIVIASKYHKNLVTEKEAKNLELLKPYEVTESTTKEELIEEIERLRMRIFELENKGNKLLSEGSSISTEFETAKEIESKKKRFQKITRVLYALNIFVTIAMIVVGMVFYSQNEYYKFESGDFAFVQFIPLICFFLMVLGIFMYNAILKKNYKTAKMLLIISLIITSLSGAYGLVEYVLGLVNYFTMINVMVMGDTARGLLELIVYVSCFIVESTLLLITPKPDEKQKA
ncbi:MAG: hypothetical protein MJZ34_14795 [Paludibacteraceae bacterium]|nr:hypothetical protein [Paludibacteraceae bacterium]